MAAVEYRNIVKSFGAVEVIRGLSFEIEPSTFTVLLGPSGCGKTTLLRLTAGLETMNSGDVLIAGNRMNDVHPRDRDIAMVFQNYALYPTMKVFENIAFSLEVRKLSTEEIRRRVGEAAATLNLTDYLDRYPRELSGGQRQRVAMGRAMVRDAKVFLFDEPLSNLDAKLRAHMRVEIRQLHNRLGSTSIYVTHDQIEAMTMADKIVLMRDGEIEQAGTPDEVYDKPANRFVADFIGTPSMNFITGEIAAVDGNPTFRAEHIQIPLPSGINVAPGQKLTCGLRPADLTIATGGEIDGQLILAEKTGADIHLHVSVGGLDMVAVVPRSTAIAAGESIRLTIDPAKVHLFDADTEQRVN
ncbi:MAG: ABC transporter ATP-binding protein [Alphaproteobacteria bacterium]